MNYAGMVQDAFVMGTIGFIFIGFIVKQILDCLIK